MEHRKKILAQAQAARVNPDALKRRPDLAHLVKKMERVERMNAEADVIIEKLAAVKNVTKANAANMAVLADALIFVIKFLQEKESEE